MPTKRRFDKTPRYTARGHDEATNPRFRSLGNVEASRSSVASRCSQFDFCTDGTRCSTVSPTWIFWRRSIDITLVVGSSGFRITHRIIRTRMCGLGSPVTEIDGQWSTCHLIHRISMQRNGCGITPASAERTTGTSSAKPSYRPHLGEYSAACNAGLNRYAGIYGLSHDKHVLLVMRGYISCSIASAYDCPEESS